MTGGNDGSGTMTAIGLMSGTSMDGIDVALVRSDGASSVQRGPFLSVPYSPAFRRSLTAALDTAEPIEDRMERPSDLSDIERDLTDLHAEAVETFVRQNGIAMETVDVVGFHGQTVLHRPERALTVQLGDGQRLADRLSVPVVYDMRAADMKAGGEGAPLAPAYHGALAVGLEQDKPVAFVNIGGISNITCVDAGGALHAFDTGPGNVLIDQWVALKAGVPFDQGGTIASEGVVLRSLVNEYLNAPFFDDPNRRSLDRNDFLPPDPDRATLEDGARSLARLTAEAVVKSAQVLNQLPKTWIVCGGGRLNSVIMGDLQEVAAVSEGQVLSAEEVGLDGDAIEAEAWAYLAIRSWKRLPLSWPDTTGCRQPTSGGVLARPADAAF